MDYLKNSRPFNWAVACAHKINNREVAGREEKEEEEEVFFWTSLIRRFSQDQKSTE